MSVKTIVIKLFLIEFPLFIFILSLRSLVGVKKILLHLFSVIHLERAKKRYATWNEELMLKNCNFRRYSRCIDCIPQLGDEFGHVRVIERINVNYRCKSGR